MRSLVFWVSFVSVTFLPESPLQAESPHVHPWEVIELTWQAEEQLENPYVEGLPDGEPPFLTVVFEGISEDAEGERLEIGGFWDGEQTWKARFAPPASGKWHYRTISRDPGLNALEGDLVCRNWSESEKEANPTRRGFLQVAEEGPRAGHVFEYADGTPMLWIGDTWWNWTKEDIELSSFERLVEDRVNKGFTIGQLFFAANGWSGSSSLLDPSCDHPKLEQIRKAETMIRFANSRGMTVWIHGWWSRPNLKEAVGARNVRRWSRYLVHRLGAYNVIWVLACEYNMHDYSGFDLEFWDQLGNCLDKEDPYERLISTHPTPPGWGGGAESPQWSTGEVLPQAPWIDYHQSQTGHGQWRNEMIPTIVRRAVNRKPPKPIVITEPWYEFEEGNPPASEVRFGVWSAILSGAAGHSYGGGHVWLAHLPESPAGGGTWPLEESSEVNTLDYPGARSVGFASRFLQKLPWWKMLPEPERVVNNPSRYCLAEAQKRYLIYLRWGGTFDLDLRNDDPNLRFRVRWFDLAKEEAVKEEWIEGGATRTLYPPADYPGLQQAKDWLVLAERVEE